jgi:hypothetical protein
MDTHVSDRPLLLPLLGARRDGESPAPYAEAFSSGWDSECPASTARTASV